MITIGGNEYETHKTTEALDEENIVTTAECAETLDVNFLQPVTKTVKQFDTITINSVFNGSLYDITLFVPFPDDYFLNGYDYIIDLTLSTTPNIFAAPNAIKFCPNYTANPISDVYYPLTALSASLNTIQINETLFGGDYMSAVRLIDINVQSPLFFQLTIDITIKQLIPASISIEQCGGMRLEIDTELETEIVQETTYTNEGVEQTSEITKRKTTYDPFYSVEEAAKIANKGSCLSYDTYYKGGILFEPYVNPSINKVFLDTGIYEMKINIPISPQQVYDFKLFNGGIFFTLTSDGDGLTQYTPFADPYPINDKSEIRIFDGGTEILESGVQYVYPKYDLTSHECPCECLETCDGYLEINFTQNCPENNVSLSLKASLHGGSYDSTGETYTPNSGIAIRPVVRQAAKYTLTIQNYSDEVWLALQELISTNNFIEIFDANGSAFYNFDLENFQPTWDAYSKYGFVNLQVIRIDTVKTFRKCCN